MERHAPRRRWVVATAFAAFAAAFLLLALEPPEARGGDVRNAYLRARIATIGIAPDPAKAFFFQALRWTVEIPLRAVVALAPDRPLLLHVPSAAAFVVAVTATALAARRCAGPGAGWLAAAALVALPHAARGASQPLPDGFVAACLALALWTASRAGRRPGDRRTPALLGVWLGLAYGARISSLVFALPFGWAVARRQGGRALAVFGGTLAAFAVADNLAILALYGRTRFGFVRGGHGSAMARFALDGPAAYLGRLAGWPVPWLVALAAGPVAYLVLRRRADRPPALDLAMGGLATYVLVLTYGLSDPIDLEPLSRLRPRYLLAVGPALAVLVGAAAAALLPRPDRPRIRWAPELAALAVAAGALASVAVASKGPRGLAAARDTLAANALVDRTVDEGRAFAGRGRRGLMALRAARALYFDLEVLEPRRDGELPAPIRLAPESPWWWLPSPRPGARAWVRCPVHAALDGRFLVLDPDRKDAECFRVPRPRRAAPPIRRRKRRKRKGTRERQGPRPK